MQKNKFKSYLISRITKFKTIKCSFLVNKKLKKNIEKFNPENEILKVCEENNMSIIINNLLKKISYNKNLECLNIISEKNVIYSQHSLIACGVFNSPKILVNSALIKENNFIFYDHSLYRIPLINLNFLFELFLKIFYGLDPKENSFTSLKEAYFKDNKKMSIFLGIYRPSFNLKLFNKLVKKLLDLNFVIFSQVFIKYTNIDYQISGSLINNSYVFNERKYPKLGVFKKLKILIFFIIKGYIPIPFKYSQRFGSSYHVYGSLKEFTMKFSFHNQNESFVQVIDSSTLKE